MNNKNMKEREELVKEKFFFILPSELFCNVCQRAKDDENLDETLEKVFKNGDTLT